MTEIPSRADDEQQPGGLLRRIFDSSQDEELECLHEILRRGVDQGWFLRPDVGDLLIPDPASMDSLHTGLIGRSQPTLSESDPWATTDPPPEAIPGQAPGWVVLTQRCDLIRSYVVEPLVELARATLLTDATEIRAARLNSPRLIAFADDGAGACWAADLRQRAWLPKPLLTRQTTLVQAVPTQRRRKQFRLRLGQRYWRDPVPDDVVAALQHPIRDALRQSRPRIALARNFIEWLGQRLDDGRILVIAVAAEGRLTDAESDWADLMTTLESAKPDAFRLIHPEESGVYSAADISFADWLDSFKFDFDEITYGRRADDQHAEPHI